MHFLSCYQSQFNFIYSDNPQSKPHRVGSKAIFCMSQNVKINNRIKCVMDSGLKGLNIRQHSEKREDFMDFYAERENSIFEKSSLSFRMRNHVDEHEEGKTNQTLLCCGNFQFDGGQDFVISNFIVISNCHDLVSSFIPRRWPFFCPTEHETT